MAQDTWTLGGKNYSVATTFQSNVGPGAVRTSVRLTGPKTVVAHYVTVDLTNPYADIRVTKAKNYTWNGISTLSTQHKDNDKEGARYIAGVNANLFYNKVPLGAVIYNGVIGNTETNELYKNNFCITEDGRARVFDGLFEGTLTTSDNQVRKINGINGTCYHNNLFIFNRNYAKNHKTRCGGNSYEIFFKIVSGEEMTLPGKFECEVTDDKAFTNKDWYGGREVPEGQYALSCFNDATKVAAGEKCENAAFIDGLKVGDRFTIDLAPNFGDKAIRNLVAGAPMLLKDGAYTSTSKVPAGLDAINPRSAVGCNNDGTKVVLVAVDGRGLNGSAGLLLNELADLMKALGCTQAVNMDGGGSAEMYSAEEGVVNKPSDGAEREVTDAIWYVSTAPASDVPAGIQFKEAAASASQFSTYTPTVVNVNAFGTVLDDATDFTLSMNPALGEILEDGKSIFLTTPGTTTLTATANGMTATAQLTVTAADIAMSADAVLLDSYTDYNASLSASANGTTAAVNNKYITWSSDATGVAEVNAEGLVHGVADGDATVSANVGEKAATLAVKVEVPVNRHQTVDLSGVTAGSKSGLNEGIVTPGEDGKTFTLAYSVKSTTSARQQCKIEKPFFSMPDSVRLVINPGDAKINYVNVGVTPKGLSKVTYRIEGTEFTENVPAIFNIDTKEFVKAGDASNYPLILTDLTFYFKGDAAAGTPHTIKVMAAEGTYTHVAAAVEDIMAPGASDAGNNAPVYYYDLNGRRMNGNSLTPGLYIRRQGRVVSKVIVK